MTEATFDVPVANPERGEVVDRLAGVQRLMRLSVDDFAKIEEMSGKGLFPFADDLAALSARFDTVIRCLALAVKSGGGSPVEDMQKFRTACYEDGLRNCSMLLLTLMQYGLHGREALVALSKTFDAAAEERSGKKRAGGGNQDPANVSPSAAG